MYTYVKRGFTLIELLVVISIIALLTLGILAALDKARAKGRDADRISDLKQIQIALEFYYAKHKEYPAEANLADDLAPVYMNIFPTDPKTDDPYDYKVDVSGTRNVNFAIQATSDDGTKTCELRSTSTFGYGSEICPNFQ